MKMGIIAAGIILLFFSGCIQLGDSTALAQKFRDERAQFIPAGLVLPTTSMARENYRTRLLDYRKQIQENGGGNADVLSAYVDAGMHLLAMNESTEMGNDFLGNVDPEFITCPPNSPADNAIDSFENSRAEAQLALDAVKKIQSNQSMENALGAEYIQNIASTVQGIRDAHARRINEIKKACAPLS